MTLKGCNCLDNFDKQDLSKAVSELISLKNRQIDFIREKAPATPVEKKFVISDIAREIGGLTNLGKQIEDTPSC